MVSKTVQRGATPRRPVPTASFGVISSSPVPWCSRSARLSVEQEVGGRHPLAPLVATRARRSTADRDPDAIRMLVRLQPCPLRLAPCRHPPPPGFLAQRAVQRFHKPPVPVRGRGKPLRSIRHDAAGSRQAWSIEHQGRFGHAAGPPRSKRDSRRSAGLGVRLSHLPLEAASCVPDACCLFAGAWRISKRGGLQNRQERGRHPPRPFSRRRRSTADCLHRKQAMRVQFPPSASFRGRVTGSPPAC